jgi:hypothetical protein
VKHIPIIFFALLSTYFIFGQAENIDTLRPSKTMQEAHVYMSGLYNNANKLIYPVDTAKQFPFDYWMKYCLKLNFPLEEKELSIVPIINSIAYDSLKLGTTHQVYQAISFKLLSPVDSSFVLETEDNRVPAIWEARNEKGEWQPVEYFHHSGCGNSYEKFLIPQKHYLIIAANYLQGDYKTKLRLKLRIGKAVYYSSELDGSISQSQFVLPKNFYGVEPLTQAYKEKRYSFEFLGEVVE